MFARGNSFFSSRTALHTLVSLKRLRTFEFLAPSDGSRGNVRESVRGFMNERVLSLVQSLELVWGREAERSARFLPISERDHDLNAGQACTWQLRIIHHPPSTGISGHPQTPADTRYWGPTPSFHVHNFRRWPHPSNQKGETGFLQR